MALWCSPDGTRRFYTRRAKRWLVPAFAWFCGAITLMGPAAEFGIYDTWQIGVTCAAAVLAVDIYVTYRASRWGVLVEPGWMTNRRMLWTNRVPAHDITRFEPPPSYGAIARSGLLVVLHDGRVLSATAFTMWRIDDDSAGSAECAELNAWLDTQRATPTAAPLH